MLPSHDQTAGGLCRARLRNALAAAGLAPDEVDTCIRASDDAIHVRILRDDGGDVTIEQLVTITAVLRSADRDGRAITAWAA